MELKMKNNKYQNEVIYRNVEKVIDLTCWVVGSGLLLSVVTTLMYGLINGLF